MVHPVVQAVTDRMIERSAPTREKFVARMERAATAPNTTRRSACGSHSCFAHQFAVASPANKDLARGEKAFNIGILSAATDMLSSHQPYYDFPPLISQTAEAHGAFAQIAGHVPAMCDGTTQGRTGMELSLFSRETILLAGTINQSHDNFDGIFYLGTCDKIKPGLIMNMGSFAHLPGIFAPSGPMSTGQTNPEKNKVRLQRALEEKGEVPVTIGPEGERISEMKSYHGRGTCTFYGTANGNEFIAEAMGLQLPGSSFVPPDTDLRDALTKDAVIRMVTKQIDPVYTILDEKAFVNGMVAFLCSGGSTNLTLHLPAMAKKHGIILTWQDLSDLSAVVPSIVKTYPNAETDINDFHNVGGTTAAFAQLLDGNLLHTDVNTVAGKGFERYAHPPALASDGTIAWQDRSVSKDPAIIASINEPFKTDGGIKVLHGRLGQAVSKTSALNPDKGSIFEIKAPAKIFNSQAELQKAFKKGELTGDFVAVVRGQGPHQNGMPELHQLITPLTALMNKGQKVALLTNGRLSGASGGVLSAIHLSVADKNAEPINKIQEGDMVIIDTIKGIVDVDIPENEWNAREFAVIDTSENEEGNGREDFAFARKLVGPAYEGATFTI